MRSNQWGNPKTEVAQPCVIFELVGEHAGETVRLGGYDFQNGELQVPHANVDAVEPRIVEYGVRRKP